MFTYIYIQHTDTLLYNTQGKTGKGERGSNKEHSENK